MPSTWNEYMERALNESVLSEMESMTYGNLPSWNEFKKQFIRKVGDDGYDYTLRGSDASTARKAKIPVSGVFDAKELYNILTKLVSAWENGNDEAGDLASSIMYTLDYEWI